MMYADRRKSFAREVKALLRYRSSVVDTVPTEFRAAVQGCLQEILRSDAFRNSRQSEKLLRYLVQHSLDGRDDLLREKQIGIAIFLREPDYDTAADSIVRVRMNEIRKRLALYYENLVPPPNVHFKIPRGSYKVEFVYSELPVAAEVEQIEPSVHRRRIPIVASIAILLGFAIAAAGIYQFRSSTDALESFWLPALNSRTPVILCLGNPVLLQWSSRFRNRLNQAATNGLLYQTMVPNIPREMTIGADDLVAIQNQYVGLGSAYAVARISSWLSRNHKETEIRFANDLSYIDLKRSAAVFIGAFQNRWTLQAMKDQRIVFDMAAGSAIVRDQHTGRSWRLPELKDDGATNEDYVIVTRVPKSDSGQFVVAAAGITQYGCQTAADVLTSSDFLPQILNRLDRKWRNKTAQVLLHVPVIGQTPGIPSVIAAYVW
jgi:hypothetical protein